MKAIDHWFAHVSGQGEADVVFQALAKELPPLSSLILDRSCQFQCQHCIFQHEAAAPSIPNADVVLNTLGQLPNPKVVHEGRQLTRRQIPLLKAVSAAGYSLGIIESGTYVTQMTEILQAGLQFDWMDVSIDGPKNIHNFQRNSERSWDVAREGIRHSRSVVKSSGKVTSLTTLTSVNHQYVLQTGAQVEDSGVDEWHLTTMSLRKGVEGLRATEKQLAIAVHQMYGSGSMPMFLRIYNLEDMGALVTILGEETFSKSLRRAQVTSNAVVLDVGFPLYFYPMSLAPGETLVIDTDGWWRLPYCIKYTLDELHAGRDKYGNDISIYNIARLTSGTDVASVFRDVVPHWQKYCGEQELARERELLQPFF